MLPERVAMRLFVACWFAASVTSGALAQGLEVQKLQGIAEATRTACLSGTQYDLTVNGDGSLSLLRKLAPGGEGQTRITQNSGTGGALNYTDEGKRLVADQQIRDCVSKMLPLMLTAAGAHLATEHAPSFPNVSPQEEVRNRIQRMGLHWSLEDFTQATLQNNQLAVELFLQGGFPPNATYPDRNEFVISLPFIDHADGRFAMLGLFRKYGLRFESEEGSPVVGFLTQLRSRGAGRYQTVADEILYAIMNMPDEIAKREVSTLLSFGLTCDRYIDSFSEFVDLSRKDVETAISRANQQLKPFAHRQGIDAEIYTSEKALYDAEISKVKSRVAPEEAYLSRIRKICASR